MRIEKFCCFVCFFVCFSGQILWALSWLIFLLSVTGFKPLGLTLGWLCLCVFPERSNWGSLTHYTCGGELAPSLGLGIQIRQKLKTGERKMSIDILCVLGVDISKVTAPVGEPEVKANPAPGQTAPPHLSFLTSDACRFCHRNEKATKTNMIWIKRSWLARLLLGLVGVRAINNLRPSHNNIVTITNRNT